MSPPRPPEQNLGRARFLGGCGSEGLLNPRFSLRKKEKLSWSKETEIRRQMHKKSQGQRQGGSELRAEPHTITSTTNADGASKRATLPHVDARIVTLRPLGVFRGEKGRRLVPGCGKGIDVVVEPGQRFGVGVAQHLVESALFCFSGQKADPRVLNCGDLRRHLRQHPTIGRTTDEVVL